jgi:hypothetical protein
MVTQCKGDARHAKSYEYNSLCGRQQTGTCMRRSAEPVFTSDYAPRIT